MGWGCVWGGGGGGELGKLLSPGSICGFVANICGSGFTTSSSLGSPLRYYFISHLKGWSNER